MFFSSGPTALAPGGGVQLAVEWTASPCLMPPSEAGGAVRLLLGLGRNPSFAGGFLFGIWFWEAYFFTSAKLSPRACFFFDLEMRCLENNFDLGWYRNG